MLVNTYMAYYIYVCYMHNHTKCKYFRVLFAICDVIDAYDVWYQVTIDNIVYTKIQHLTSKYTEQCFIPLLKCVCKWLAADNNGIIVNRIYFINMNVIRGSIHSIQLQFWPTLNSSKIITFWIIRKISFLSRLINGCKQGNISMKLT